MKKVQLHGEVMVKANAIEAGKKVTEDFSVLNRILFKLQGDFGFSADRKLKEMSAQNDGEIRTLMSKIVSNLRAMKDALENGERQAPCSKKDMDDVMIRIMINYMTTSVNIQLDAQIGETYTKEVKKIYSSLNDLSEALNKYNKLARKKGWPELMSEDEAFATAKKRLSEIEC